MSTLTPQWPPDATLYDFTELPLGRDVHVLGESQMLELHQQWLRYLAEPDDTAPRHPNASIDYRMCAIEVIRDESCEVNVCISQSTRYHPAVQTLPRSEFVACVHYRDYQKRPYLVVSQAWYDDIARLHFSLYGLVDAVGMRMLLAQHGRITRAQVDALRVGLEALADSHPEFAFFAFADSVLVKTNWLAASPEYNVTYRPEFFLSVLLQVAGVFKSALGLDAYAIATQGSNQFVDDALLTISRRQNHVFFGSLGTPFAELFEIDHAVREALRNKSHGPGSLYLSHAIFLTLNFSDYDHRDKLLETSQPFSSKLTTHDFCRYHVFEHAELLRQIAEPA